jgi:predicted MFS family arabinose efflux permease
MSMVQAGAFVLPPLLAVALLAAIGLRGVLAVDVATFLFAVSLTLLLAIPQPAASAAAGRGVGAIWQEMGESLRYLRARPGLVKLLWIFAGANGIFAVFLGLVSPLVLARSGHDARRLGVVLSANGLGGVLAGLALSLSGGPKRRMRGVLAGIVAMNFLGILVVGLGRSLPVWAAGALVVGACVAFTNGCALAIVQSKVEPALQGRIFGVVRVLAQASVPLALALAGPLADYLFEPAMRGGPLADALGPLVGRGPGAGMSAMLVLAGALGGLIGLAGAAVREIREVDLLPEPVDVGAGEPG